ncbi:hypothetical protein GGR52DRAFT_531705 [Hypoxylon sp. FL1284]|nr:hypothetical protein GGR52DRAFT_531705 [Hypoxylon sp. FL1284]
MNGPGSLNGSRLPPNPPGTRHDPSYDAALRGASLAFQKTTPKQPPKSSPSSRHVDSRAIIAANSATSASRDHSRTVSRQTTGGSGSQGGGSSHDVDQGIKGQQLTQRLQPLAQRSHANPSLTHLTPQGKPTMVDPHSPSFIAASLAASRNASPIRHQAMQSLQHAQPPARTRRKHNVSANVSADSSVTSLELATDTTSIPSTNTLVSMFEKKEDYTDPVKKQLRASDSRRSLKAEVKPQSQTLPRSTEPRGKDDVSPSRLASTAAWKRATSPSASESSAMQTKQPQPQKVVLDSKKRPPTPPPSRTRHDVDITTHSDAPGSKRKPRDSTPPPKSTSPTNTVILAPEVKRPASQRTIVNDVRTQDVIATKDRELQSTRPAPEYPTPTRDVAAERSTAPSKHYQSSPSSDGSFVSASSAPISASDSPIRGRSRPPSPSSKARSRQPNQPRPLSTYSHTSNALRPHTLTGRSQQQNPAWSNLSVDSLANAMVASSLASSRMTPSSSSAAQAPPPHPPRHKATPTPHMRQTLRQPPSKSDDEEDMDGARSRQRHHRRRKLGGGGKHVHHEGSRRRWREEITARERKRYEGVWASNRGLLLVSPSSSSSSSSSPPSSSPHPHPPRRAGTKESVAEAKGKKREEREQLVANAVARDIWGRSRLPADELAEVWDLVDRRRMGALDRAEFVVGMWLIDQRLRGRKIPRKVGDSVWGSAVAGGVRVGSLRRRGK